MVVVVILVSVVVVVPGGGISPSALGYREVGLSGTRTEVKYAREHERGGFTVHLS